MKIEVNVNKRKFLVLMFGFLLLAGSVFTYAYNEGYNLQSPTYKGSEKAITFGHSSDEVIIKVGNEIKTLQELYDTNQLIKNPGTTTPPVNTNTVSGFTTMRIFVSGSNTLTLPTGVSSVRVRMLGGGGGSAAVGSMGKDVVIGYAGSYGEGIINVKPGSTITYTVGVGGAGRGSSQSGLAGGNSVISYKDKDDNQKSAQAGGGAGGAGVDGSSSGGSTSGLIVSASPTGSTPVPISDIGSFGYGGTSYSSVRTGVSGTGGYIILEY